MISFGNQHRHMPATCRVAAGTAGRRRTAESRCATGIAWDFPLAKSEKRELLLQHFALGEQHLGGERSPEPCFVCGLGSLGSSEERTHSSEKR